MAKVVPPAVEPATVEHFIYDGAAGAVDDDKQIVLRFDAAGQVSNRYLHGPALDMVLADEQLDPSTGALDHVYWLLGDNLGTVRDMAEYDDQSGITAIANHIQYDAFGGITSQTNRRTRRSTRSSASPGASRTPRAICTTIGPDITTRAWASSPARTRSALMPRTPTSDATSATARWTRPIQAARST